MYKTFKYRIYPTDKQGELIAKHIGCSRFIYNLALETKKSAHSSGFNLNIYDLQRQLKDLKKACPWLKEVNSQSLVASLFNLEFAYSRFFKGLNKFPVFKKKINSGSFSVPQYARLENNKLIIPKFKSGINIILHRNLIGEIRKATISKTPTGKYFASILTEIKSDIPKKASIDPGNTIGLDLGIKSFLVLSSGQKFDNPTFLKRSISRLKYLNRRFSKNKGKRTKYKLSSLHEKVANQRKDFLHKTSSKIISDNQTICIEDLNISGMVKNRTLSQSISDSGWGEFIRQLKYKAEWCGKNIVVIGRFDPSSKTCSCCGNINRGLTLEDRQWSCNRCGSVLDRDINAAINIKNFGLKNISSVERRLKNRNELPALAGVMTSETA